MKAQSLSQAGFTLIELIIALALGLVISAAAFMLFLTSQKVYLLQQGAVDIQDNANFGLSYITKDLRYINLNNYSSLVNDRTHFGGVVLTSSVNADKDTDGITPLSNLTKTIVGSTAAVELLSQSEIGPSNINGVASDQLVIQYKPQYILDDKGTTGSDEKTLDDEWVGGFDCEGAEIRSLAKEKKKDESGNDIIVDRPQRIVVQRYFLREDNNKASNEPNTSLALACDAGWYMDNATPTKIENYGDNGQIILKRVDYFHIMLGIQNGNNHRYISIKEYMGLASPKPRILSVQLGVLARSTQAVGHDATFKDDQVFSVLDQDVRVKTATGKQKYVRQVISQTVALRNTFGERGQ
ncbi:PilW family protein [Acinetobacter gyllenbergii]|uniref:PilW family protein n=1 Tax=Acinetobacter gyllenbergii TaxID=134534 RepID=UPI00241BEBF3|nr:PilW family protein [Acinetobacter gyllenbergii]